MLKQRKSSLWINGNTIVLPDQRVEQAWLHILQSGGPPLDGLGGVKNVKFRLSLQRAWVWAGWWWGGCQPAGIWLGLDPANTGRTHPKGCLLAVNADNLSLTWHWAVEIRAGPLCGLLTRWSCPWPCLHSHVTTSEPLGLCGAVKGRSLCVWIWKSGERHTSVYDDKTTTSHPVTELHNLSIMGHVSGPILSDRDMELSRDMAQCHPWGMQVSVGPCELGTS